MLAPDFGSQFKQSCIDYQPPNLQRCGVVENKSTFACRSTVVDHGASSASTNRRGKPHTFGGRCVEEKAEADLWRKPNASAGTIGQAETKTYGHERKLGRFYKTKGGFTYNR